MSILTSAYPIGPTMRQRILRALQGGPVTGQTELIRALKLGPESLGSFNATLRVCLGQGEVREVRRQLAATGHEGPPVYEYIYSIAPGVKP
jgi:hypothetical protein